MADDILSKFKKKADDTIAGVKKTADDYGQAAKWLMGNADVATGTAQYRIAGDVLQKANDDFDRNQAAMKKAKAGQ